MTRSQEGEKTQMNIVNPSRQALAAGGLSVGVGVRAVRGIEIARIMKTAGFDFLFIDLEHGPTSVETASSICVAALDAGIAPIVRVPHMDLQLATRCLDGGALGIVVPHVDTAEQAKAVVDALRYAPHGHRSVAGGYPQFGFAAVPLKDAIQSMNDATMVVVMIETPEAVANADAIAAVPGVDVLLMGTNDLCVELGIPGEIGHQKIIESIDRIVDACNHHGKWAGLGGVYGKAQLEPYVARGMRFILAGNDLGLLMGAATDQAKFVRACL
jgi:4-hydroxy-2-oxoheptanedioate aldolase